MNSFTFLTSYSCLPTKLAGPREDASDTNHVSAEDGKPLFGLNHFATLELSPSVAPGLEAKMA